MSMWFGLRGPILRFIGTSGTVTIPAGAKVLQIKAHATTAGSVKIFGDSNAITLPASSGWFYLQENHAGLVAPTGSNTIVFTSTDSYYVEYTTEGS